MALVRVSQEAQGHAGLQGARAAAGTGRQAFCLRVSAISTPALLASGEPETQFPHLCSGF